MNCVGLLHFVTEKVTSCEEKEEKQRPANAPLIIQRDAELQLSAESSAKCCNSKGKGSVYDSV